jgi:hypothetical protein
MQLLSSSHTFKETVDRPGTYRLGKRRIVPRFESSRGSAYREPARIVRTTAEIQPSSFSDCIAAPKPVVQQPVPTPTDSVAPVKEVRPVVAPAPILPELPVQKVEPAPTLQAQPKPDTSHAETSHAETSHAESRLGTRPIGSTLSPVQSGDRSADARSLKTVVRECVALAMGRRLPVTAQQTELSLEKVKVECNDFSSPSDYDVVAPTRKSSAEIASGRKLAARLTRLVAKVFGGTKNEFKPASTPVEPRQGTLIPRS